jgi:AcrR family transcriptional regulator
MVRQIERSSATISAILGAARKLFAANGFEDTTIDAIGAKANTAKGAVYHHFDSKAAIFTRVLEDVQSEIAAAPIPAAALKIVDPLDQIAAGVLRYLNAATEPGIKRILLIDGPAIVGWRKWREIDDHYFGARTKAALAIVLGKDASARELEALTHLVIGAVMEAALVCATAEDSKRMARDHASSLRKMLAGLRA